MTFFSHPVLIYNLSNKNLENAVNNCLVFLSLKQLTEIIHAYFR